MSQVEDRSVTNQSTRMTDEFAPPPATRIGIRDPRSKQAQRLAYIRHHQLEFVNAWLQLWLTPLATLLSILVMGMALCLPITLWVLMGNIKDLTGFWDDGAQLTVYMTPAVTDQAGAALGARVAGLESVESIRVISKEEGLAQLETAMGVNRFGLESNPLPVAFRITPSSTDERIVSKLERKLQAWPEIDSVVWDRLWFKRLQSLLIFFDRVLLVFCTGLATLIVLVVLTATRLAIYHRTAETQVLRLFGASDRYIRRPFLYAGAWLGFWAGIVALLLASVASQWLAAPAVDLLQSYLGSQSFASITWIMALQTLLLAVGLAWLGAWIATGHYISKD